MTAVGVVLLALVVGSVIKEEPPEGGDFDDFVWKFSAGDINTKEVADRLISEIGDLEILSSNNGDNIVANKGEGLEKKKTLRQVIFSDTPDAEYVFDRNHILLKPNFHWARQLLLSHLSQYIPSESNATAGVADFSFYLIAGPAGKKTGVPMHRHADAVLLLLSGKKNWLVSRPGPLDKVANKQYEVVQSEGEIVVVPEGWWHSVENEATETGDPIIAIGLQKLIPRTDELSTVVVASSLAADGYPDDAISELLKHVDNEKLGMISSSLSTLYLRKGDDQAALQWAKKGIKKDPTLQEAIVNLCTSSVHLEKGPTAHKYCGKMIPKNALHHQTLAFYHLQMNDDVMKAIDVIQGFIPSCSESVPCPQSIFYSLGKLQMAVGRYEDSIASLFEAYQIDTTNTAVIAALREVRNILHEKGEL
eukprot:TRINITY_DN14130_c0_g1_i1.p1 TRINITY_DN14130_c0_g1~~TRINITY_DN14130_c0_g1_i1.p1  ORF type:complete len:420 (+),score=88.67 TRINITY_DN14130_c0_g1_i1:80-1339(+)